MSGAKGRSGGARPGAGRKPRDPGTFAVPVTEDPLAFMLSVMNDSQADPRLRLQAAIAAAQYKHVKKGEGGKGDERKSKAKEAGAGKFAPSAPPKLVVNNG